MGLLRRSCDELEQTTIVVTHDPRAAAYADRIVFLRDGQEQERLTFNNATNLSDRVRVIMNIMEKMEI